MHLRDKIGFGLVGFSIVMAMATDTHWVRDHTTIEHLLYICWCLPLFWMIPQVWKDNTPRCSLAEWRSMRQLGYSWQRWPARFQGGDDGEWHVDYVNGLWQHVHFLEWRDTAKARRSTPVPTPTAAHVLGRLNQGDFTHDEDYH